MSPQSKPGGGISVPARLTALCAAALALAACTTDKPFDPAEGIGFRESRFEQISRTREYRSCRDQGYEHDRQARSAGSLGAYLTSARVLEKCEAEIGPDGNGVAEDERMRAYALSVQNHFKGGDIESARSNFDRFKKTFASRDLYYPDGTSFIATMETLLGRHQGWTLGEFSALNVNNELKAEMRRVIYWQNK